MIYLKKIISQDISRTPTVSMDAAKFFFNLDFSNDDKVDLSVKLINTSETFSVQMIMRHTRGEYRFFINREIFPVVSPSVGDILIFKKISQGYSCEYISQASNNYSPFSELFEGSSNHQLIIEDASFGTVVSEKFTKRDLIKAFRAYVSATTSSASSISNYTNALTLMPPYLRKKGVSCPDVWNENVDRSQLLAAANFVRTQKNNNDEGQYFSEYEPKSHWANGWFPSGVNKFFKFLDSLAIEEETIIPMEELNSDNFNISNFIDSLNNANLSVADSLPYRFVSALQTKPFVILTGLSGSGKTKLAEAFSLWISQSPDQYQMVSVGADWTNREPLLGFPNALAPGEYVKPDTGVLELLLRADKDETRPYFLILDEMNMSHVERYFADFLSAMESIEGEIALHPEGEEWKDCDVSSTLKLPENLFIIGTVNIDETTYMFSPKVLDRANVIEFRVSAAEMEEYLTNPKTLDMSLLKNKGASMGSSFVEGANSSVSVSSNLAEELLPFFRELQKTGSEFGYRTASEIGRFVAVCTDMAKNEMNEDEIIDAAVMQKLLPKVHGSRNKIEKILETLGKLCLEESAERPFLSETTNIKYPLSYEKLERMHTRVLSDGFTSFAEA